MALFIDKMNKITNKVRSFMAFFWLEGQRQTDAKAQALTQRTLRV